MFKCYLSEFRFKYYFETSFGNEFSEFEFSLQVAFIRSVLRCNRNVKPVESFPAIQKAISELSLSLWKSTKSVSEKSENQRNNYQSCGKLSWHHRKPFWKWRDEVRKELLERTSESLTETQSGRFQIPLVWRVFSKSSLFVQVNVYGRRKPWKRTKPELSISKKKIMEWISHTFIS